MGIQIVKKILIPILIIAAAIVVFMFMKSTKPQQAAIPVQEKVWVVEYLEAQYQSLAPVQRLYGQVESARPISMSAPISGVVGNVSV